MFRLRRLVRLSGLTFLLADEFGGVVVTVGDENRWEKRGPFEQGELMPVAPGRWRASFQKHVTRPADRLAWLLMRFSASAVETRAR